MSRTIETQVFTFAELSEEAKEVARDWYRGLGFESDELTDYDDWTQVAAILGIEFDTRRNSSQPAIYWSGFYSQGDGACFEGRYKYAKGAAKKIRDYAPKDLELHKIADSLQSAQSRNFYSLEANTKHSGHYYHSGCMSVDVEDSRDMWRDIGEAGNDVTQALRDFADWIYACLESQNDYRMSDESVDESILANGYEFDEGGNAA